MAEQNEEQQQPQVDQKVRKVLDSLAATVSYFHLQGQSGKVQLTVEFDQGKVTRHFQSGDEEMG